jgi:hypothetical protein
MLYAECGDRLTDAGADRPKLGLSPPNRTLPLSATLAGVARISMVIFSSCFCIVVSVPVVALRANRTDEVAALVQLSGIPFRAIAPKIGHPFTYIAALAVLSDKFGPLRSHRVHSTRSFGHQIGLSPDRSKPLVWQVWIGRDDVLGFQLSTGHSSIVLRCVNNRLPEHQSEQAHHCYGDCNGDVCLHGTPQSPLVGRHEERLPARGETAM